MTVGRWWIGACAALAFGCAEETSDPASRDDSGASTVQGAATAAPSFARTAVDEDAYGPAFADIGDVNGDGKPDLLVSAFGTLEMVREDVLPNGRVSVYLQGDGVDDWTREDVVSVDDGIVWPNAVTFEDVDGDDDLDVMVGYGFLTCLIKGTPCGGLAWMENDGSGGWVRHDIVDAGQDSFFHEGVLIDIDGDEVLDLLTTEETFGMTSLYWFKGDDSEDRFDKEARVIGDMAGSKPEPYDVDGDGDLDIVSGEFFRAQPATAVWIERTGDVTEEQPAGGWERHVIDAAAGPAIQASVVEDLFGDGRNYVVASTHTNIHADGMESVLIGYAIPEDPYAEWQGEILSEGIEAIPNEGFAMNLAPGIFGDGDIDGDGDTDILLSGDGDPRVFWLEQTDVGEMTTHVLEETMPQAGGMKVHDLDGDGKNELLVCGYENNSIYIYRR